MYSTDTCESLALGLLAVVGCVTNAVSLVKSLAKFKVAQPIFFLLALDIVISFAGAATVLVLVVANAAGISEKGWWPCFLLFLSTYFPSYMGPALTAQIAGLRYLALTRALVNKTLSIDTGRRIAAVATAAATGLFAAWLLGLHATNRPLNTVVETCMRGEEARPAVFQALVNGGCIAAFTFVSIGLDLKGVRVLHLHFGGHVANGMRADTRHAFLRRVAKVPVTATLTSSLLLLPFIVITSAAANLLRPFSRVTSAQCVSLLAVLFLSIRAPVMLHVTLQTQMASECRMRMEGTELRRKWVLHHARVERHLRQMQSQRL